VVTILSFILASIYISYFEISVKIFIIGYMHPKYDKRVFRTVKALSKDNEVIYQYWTDKEEIESKEGNIFYNTSVL